MPVTVVVGITVAAPVSLGHVYIPLITGFATNIGPVSPLVTNASAPQVCDLGMAAGFAALFVGSLFGNSTTASADEFQYGTHAQAIYNSQFPGLVVKPTTSPQGPTVSPLQGAPQNIDLTIQGSIFKPLAAPQGPVRPIVSAPAQTPDQVQPQLTKSQPASVVVATALKQLYAAPQADTSQVQGQIFGIPVVPPVPTGSDQYEFGTHATTIANSQFPGAVWASVRTPSVVVANTPRTLFGAPQSDPTQIQPSVWGPVALTAQGYLILVADGTPQQVDLTIQGWVRGTSGPIQGKVPPLVQGAPQQADLSLKAVLTQPLSRVCYAVPQLWASPQYVDLTIQGWVEETAPQMQGKVPALTRDDPQIADLTLQATFTASSSTPPVLGPTIRQFVVPAQSDLNVSYSVVWTPSTFSPSAPLPPVKFGPIRVVTAKVGLQYNYAQIQQPGVFKWPT